MISRQWADHDPQGLALGMLLAMTGMDRGGHGPAGAVCENILAYLESLPEFRDAGLTVSPR
jgi:hypothetical protein